jgi:hypothetical protein
MKNKGARLEVRWEKEKKKATKVKKIGLNCKL